MNLRRSVCVLWNAWPVYLARYYVRELYRAMPGPWWVKVLRIVACQLIPGGFDELALIAVTRAYRVWRARKQVSVYGN